MSVWGVSFVVHSNKSERARWHRNMIIHPLEHWVKPRATSFFKVFPFKLMKHSCHTASPPIIILNTYSCTPLQILWSCGFQMAPLYSKIDLIGDKYACQSLWAAGGKIWDSNVNKQCGDAFDYCLWYMVWPLKFAVDVDAYRYLSSWTSWSTWLNIVNGAAKPDDS